MQYAQHGDIEDLLPLCSR